MPGFETETFNLLCLRQSNTIVFVDYIKRIYFYFFRKAVSEDSCRSCEKNVKNMWGNEVPARASASPGLLRRRYSVPETIMRKYV